MEVTLLTEDTRVHYTGDGVTKEFSYSFNPIDLSYVKVYKNLQQITTPDVTVASGVVTFNVAPAEGDSVVIMREKPLTYDSGIASKGIISSDSLDNMAVDLLGQIQQVNEKLDRVPVYSIDTTMTGEEILNQFNQDVQTVKDSRVEVEGKAEEINNTVSSGLTEISNATSESKSQITEEKNTSISEIQRVTEGLIDRAEVAADESESWANKAEIFANQANLDSIRTNCLTVIPDDIKLKLNDGTLTLKAGSKIHFGYREAVVIQKDLQLGRSSNNAEFVMIDSDGLSANYWRPTICYSGKTPPTVTGTAIYYNTDDGHFYYTTNSGTNWTQSGMSLPICLISQQASAPYVLSIDQVFNGFGYIGNTIFALPGVEGLIPNGFVGKQRNNIKFTTSSVLTSTRNNAYDDYDIILRQNEITNSLLTYDFANNIMLNFVGSAVSYAVVGKVSADSTGRITSFNPKTVFQAPDYQDVPKLAVDNTFTGLNTFERGAVFIKNVNIDRNVNPSASQYASYLIHDKNGKQICNFYVSQSTTGTMTANMVATGRDGVDARISVSRDVNGTTISSAPTPPTSDNSTQIATTNWVADPNKSTNIVHRSGDETISGVKTFDGSQIFLGNSRVKMKAPGIDISVKPSTTLYNYVDYMDKNNKRIGIFGAFQDALGNYGVYLQAGNQGNLNLITDGTNVFANAPTPPVYDNSTQIATTAWVRNAVGVQIGTIIAFAGSSAPTGYLACNGAAVSRTTYSTLFKVIGTRWGSGDGSTTFNLPNLNSGRFLRGNSSAGGYNNAGLPNITGSFTLVAGASISERTGAFYAGNSIGADQMGGTGAMTNVTQFSAQRSSAIYGASSTVMPLSANVLFCIKY